HHRLPGAQGGTSGHHRDGDRGRDEGGKNVVTAVPGRAVGVAPAIILGQQVAQGGEQVVVGSSSYLDDGHPGGGVRHEYGGQAVAAVATELGQPTGEVDHARPAAGGEFLFLGGEAHALSPRKISETEESMKIACRASETMGAIDSTWMVSRAAMSSETGRVLVTMTSSMGAFLMRSRAGPEKMAWVAAIRTEVAPAARTISA